MQASVFPVFVVCGMDVLIFGGQCKNEKTRFKLW